MTHQNKKPKKPRTSGYRPHVHFWGMQPRDLPLFNALYHVPVMMLEPTIRLGLAMRAGPLCQTEFAYKQGDEWVPGIEADDPTIGDFVERNLKRIWDLHIGGLLDAQKWGWAAAEVVLKQTSAGFIEIAELLHRQAQDVRPLTRNGKVAGVRFLRIEDAENGRVDLEYPYCLWHPFRPEPGQYFGVSICKGAFSPFWDKWMDGGALDVRRLFMHKDAYGGVDVSYPDGFTEIPITTGSLETRSTPNANIAREMAEQIKAGGVTTRPAQYDQSGKELWTVTRATVPANPAHILTYPKDLDTEMNRGLEIPDDVLESTDGSGGAWAGKTVPQGAFYTGLELWRTGLFGDIKPVLDHLVRLNFSGRKTWYSIKAKPMALQATEQQGKQPSGASAPAPNPLMMSLEAIGRGLPAGPIVKVARRSRAIRMDSSPKGAKWITIGGRSKGDKKHHGGFPVQIDSEGRILKGGPKGLRGKHVSEVGKHFNETRESRAKDNDDFFAKAGAELRDSIAAAKKEADADFEARGAGNTRSLKKIVAYQAEKWGMEEETYKQFMAEIMDEQTKRLRERENVKDSLRKMLGINAGTLRRLQERGGNDGRGGDYSDVKGMDEAAEFLQGNFPHLMKSDNAEQEAWDLVIEGKRRPFSDTSREFHDAIDERLEELMQTAGNDYTPDESSDADADAEEFGRFMSLRRVRMSKDAQGREHKGKGEGGGQFTSSGSGDGGDDEPFSLKNKPSHGKGEFRTAKSKQRDLFAGRGDAPGQMSFFDDIDPAAKNVADQGSGDAHTERIKAAHDLVKTLLGKGDESTGRQIIAERAKEQAKANYNPNQKRAKAGGEIGPNGESYNAGAFIATTDMPKKVKAKIAQAAAGKVVIEPGKWGVPNSGELSILDAIGGTYFNHRDGSVNEGFMEYQRDDEEKRQQVHAAAKAYREGKRLVSVTEFPRLAKYNDIARMMRAEMPIPVSLVPMAKAVFGASFDRYKPNKEGSANA